MASGKHNLCSHTSASIVFQFPNTVQLCFGIEREKKLDASHLGADR